MHMVNDKGEAVYYNLVRKNNKDYWLVQGIGSTVVYGRDREAIHKNASDTAIWLSCHIQRGGTENQPSPKPYQQKCNRAPRHNDWRNRRIRGI